MNTDTKNKVKEILPYAIAGAGIVWAVTRYFKKEATSQTMTDRFVSSAKETASTVRDKAEKFAETAQDATMRGAEKVKSFADEKPWLVGAGLIGASMMMNWLAPKSTEDLNQNLKSGVRRYVDNAMSRGKELVNVAAEEAKNAATEVRRNIANGFSA
jgi:hypothetical protein